jgi:hypothetical protein
MRDSRLEVHYFVNDFEYGHCQLVDNDGMVL